MQRRATPPSDPGSRATAAGPAGGRPAAGAGSTADGLAVPAGPGRGATGVAAGPGSAATARDPGARTAGAAGRGPARTRLPAGFAVVLDRRVRVLDGGDVLVGGALPLMLRLAPAGRALLAAGRVLRVTDPTSGALARRLLDAGMAHPAPHPGRPVPGLPSPVVPRSEVPGSEVPGSGVLSPGVPGSGAPGAVPVPGPEDLTVVVPVRDRTAGLARLLAALPSGLGGVIVVDDGSADPVAVREVATTGGARALRHERARGPAAARNAGLAASDTPLVAFLDSDVVPEPGWLPPLLALFADPAVGLAAPRIVALAPVHGWLGRYEAVRSSLDLGTDPAPVVPRSRVAYVPSAAMLVRREAAGSGFDERMRVAEDVDLVLRLHEAGWRLRYEPASRVAHDHRTNLRGWWSRKAYYGTGAAPLAVRHPGSVPPMVLSPWSAAVGGLLLLGRPRAVLAAVAVSAVAAARLARRMERLHRPRATAARLVALGAVGAAAQTADAVTRHYWPLSALACLVSRRARRTVAVVALAEGVVDWWRHRDRDGRVRPGLPGYLLARRLDDLAYGAGLWWGALRHRTLEPLRPVGAATPGRPRRRARPPGTPGARRGREPTSGSFVA